MAEVSKIAWTDSTFNPWIGCTKIGPGCDHCYAEAQDSRKRWGGTTHWGAGVARYRTSASNWAQPLRWNKAAAASGKVHRVFCASLADVADNEIPHLWRQDFVRLVEITKDLSWLLVTKRIGNFKRGMFPDRWFDDGFPPNVRILITVCNQEEADRDILKLLALPCKNGISYEPALGSVNWRRWLMSPDEKVAYPVGFDMEVPRSIDWIIVGGESAQGGAAARPFDLAWARSTIAQCRAAGVPVFVKQVGSRPMYEFSQGCDAFPSYADRAGADPSEWPEDLRIREFPR